MDLVYAWIASLASATEPLIVKASSKSIIRNPWLFNVLWVAFGIPLVAVFALLRGAGFPSNWTIVLLLALSHAGFYVFYTISLYKIDVSTMSPLFSLRTVFALILGVWLLHEKLSGLDVILVTIIILASPLAAYDERMKLKAFFQKPVFLAILGMLFLAFTGYFTNLSSKINGYATTLLWLDIFVLVLLLPTLKFAELEKNHLTTKKLFPFVLLGLAGFAYTASATKAYSQNLSLSSVIVSLPLSMILVILFSRKYGHLLETHSYKVYAVRLTAAFIMVGAAILLSWV